MNEFRERALRERALFDDLALKIGRVRGRIDKGSRHASYDFMLSKDGYRCSVCPRVFKRFVDEGKIREDGTIIGSAE